MFSEFFSNDQRRLASGIEIESPKEIGRVISLQYCTIKTKLPFVQAGNMDSKYDLHEICAIP